MKKDRGTRSIAIVAIILSVLGLTVGYSALSQTLTINGTGKVMGNDWNVVWTNLSDPVLSGTATAPLKDTITISDTSITLTDLILRLPGDSIEYTFDVSNTGDIDAKIGTISINQPEYSGTGETSTTDVSTVQNNFQYQLSYANGSAIAEGDILNAGETKNLRLTVTYKQTATEIPKNDVVITNFGTQIIYTQK